MTQQETHRETTWLQRWGWPIGIVCVFMTSLTICTVTVVLATNNPSAITEEDYYAKAVAWDDLVAERRASEALGWKAKVRVTHDAFELDLEDDRGHAVLGAEVTSLAFHHAHREAAQELTWTGGSAMNPSYRIEIPSAKSGLWQLRIRAKLGEHVFLDVMDVELER